MVVPGAPNAIDAVLAIRLRPDAGQLMQEDDVQHTPDCWQQARQAAKECCIAGDASGHAVSKNAIASSANKPAPAATCAFMCRKPIPTSITPTRTAPIKAKIVMHPNGS